MTSLEQLQWHKFPCTSDGFVTLVDVMGDDAAVVQAARVSYGKDKRGVEFPPAGANNEEVDKFFAEIDKQEDAKKKDYRGLIRYLMRHRHTTPFEMCEIKLLVRVPMDCWRQWIRTRTASTNEYSTRYQPAIDSRQTTNEDEWRLQATKNKQGSSGLLEEWPEGWSYEAKTRLGYIKTPNGTHAISLKKADVSTPGKYLSYLESQNNARSTDNYKRRLALGVAREQARKDLPLSTYTEAYWKIDLHNLLHFLSLRMDGHAQKEIRDYATIIGTEIVAKLFPLTWEAFCDYRLNAITLSASDLDAMRHAASDGGTFRFPNEASTMLCYHQGATGEVDEFEYKLARMGFKSNNYDGKRPFTP